MAYKLKVTRRALAEAYKTYEWLAKDSPARATRWLQNLFAKIESLKSDPERCPVADEGSEFKEEIREFLVGKRPNVHRVLFTIQESTVVVVHSA
jgi:plasmid stabilization system protein ParE